MPGELFTAADIRRLAHEQKTNLLVLGARDLITPEAVDVARQLGIQLVREETAVAGSGTAPATRPANIRLPPIKLARRSEIALQPFGAGARGVSVALADVVAEADGSPMAAGYMALDATQPGGGVFAWTLNYDEVDIVLEGELVITRGDEQVSGRAGDVIFIAKGSSITFGTPSFTRFVYVAHPVNWADVEK